MMKISIAMTAFNGANYIVQQLESLINQKRKADEVIIIDDCSSDGTASIIQEYLTLKKLSNWQYIKNESRLGYIKNFKKAISKCQGDIILLCDQDDIWEDNKTALLESTFKKNTAIRVLATSASFIDAQNRVMKRSFPVFHFQNVPDGEIRKIELNQIFEKNCFPGCTIAFRKEIALKYLRAESEYMEHDWTICLIGAMEEGLYWLNSKLIRYRIHSENTIGLSRIRYKYINYAFWTLATWEIYIEGLYKRAAFLKRTNLRDEYALDILWAENRYASVVEKKYFFYFRNLYLWIKLNHKYDRRGIILDGLKMIMPVHKTNAS